MISAPSTPMMSPERKREIRRLTSGRLHPMQLAQDGTCDRSLWDRFAYPMKVVLYIAISVGFLSAVYLFFGRLIGQLAMGVILISGFYFLLPKWERDVPELREKSRTHAHRLCVWCTYPLTGLPNRAQCPECGTSFDMNASVVVNSARYGPARRQKSKLERRTLNQCLKRAYARLLRERDRAHPTSQPSSP